MLMDIINLLKPEIVELLEAHEQGRVVILPDRAEEQLFGVENALGVILHRWQVAYIWGNSQYLMPGRATGKTFAQIIKLCLSEGCPIIMAANRPLNMDGLGVVIPESYERYHWFRASVQNIYRKLQMYDVPGLRKIYFSDAEAKEFGFFPWGF
jgi:hypothetical protein